MMFVVNDRSWLSLRNRPSRLLVVACLYLVALYYRPILEVFSSWEFIGRYLGRIIGLSLVFVLVANQNSRSILLMRRHVYYIVGSIVVLATSSLLSGNIEMDEFTARLYDILSCIIAYIAFLYLSMKDDNARVIIYVLTLLAIGNALVGVYGSLTGKSILTFSNSDFGPGVFGFDAMSGKSGGIRGENYVGVWNAPTIAVGLMLIVRSGNLRAKAFGAFLILIGFASLAASLSRGSLVSGITVFLVGLAIFKRNLTKSLLAGLLMCFIAFLSLNLLSEQAGYFSTRVSADFNLKFSVDGLLHEERLYLWKEYWIAFTSFPVFGNPDFINGQVAKGNYVPHNLFLHVLVEYGLVGFSMYCLPFIFFIKALVFYLKNETALDDYGRIACASLWGIVAGLFFLSDPFSKLLWILGGCLQGRVMRSKYTVNLACVNEKVVTNKAQAEKPHLYCT